MIPKVAIYNGLNYNHSLFGYLCYHYPSAIIYNKYENSWLDYYYSSIFPEITINNFKTFETDISSFSLIFLLNDDDETFKEKWLKEYQLWEKVIKIKQINKNRNISIPRYINIRSFEEDFQKYAIPCFPLKLNVKRDNDIKILAANSLMPHYEKNDLKFLEQSLDKTLIFFNDQENPEKLINLFSQAHYFYYGLNKSSYYNRVTLSMYIYLAMSCGVQIIIKKYTNRHLKLNSAKVYREISNLALNNYDNKKVFDECYNNILRFKKIIQNYSQEKRKTLSLISSQNNEKTYLAILLLLFGIVCIFIILKKRILK